MGIGDTGKDKKRRDRDISETTGNTQPTGVPEGKIFLRDAL